MALNPNAIAFTGLANEYCQAVENAREYEQSDFVKTMLKLLPRLYITATDLHVNEADQYDAYIDSALDEDYYDSVRRGMEEVFGPGFAGTVDITGFGSLDEAEGWLLERGLKLWERLGRQRSDSAWKTVERAKSFIEEHYADSGLSVETLCAHLHLSPAYFSTLFKRETQKSFTAYVTDLRMDHAAQMLRDTDEKTYLIAERAGYADPNYFSYVFKRHFGVSPSKYRAGERQG